MCFLTLARMLDTPFWLLLGKCSTLAKQFLSRRMPFVSRRRSRHRSTSCARALRALSLSPTRNSASSITKAGANAIKNLAADSGLIELRRIDTCQGRVVADHLKIAADTFE